MATEWNMTMFQGETWRRQFEWQDSLGVPYPLAGWKARLQLRRKYADDDTTTPLIDIDNGDKGGITLTSPGVITIVVADTVTSAVPKGNHFYDLELEDPDGSVEKFLYGKITVKPEVTR